MFTSAMFRFAAFNETLSQNRGYHRYAPSPFLIFLFLFSGVLPTARATLVTDDFSDLNDTANPSWSHLDGAVGSTDQTWDASTGQYRLTAPGNSTVPGLETLGFVGSYVDPAYTDVQVMADVVNFVNHNPFVGFQSFGVATHLNGDNSLPNITTGIQLHGYAYLYETNHQEMVLTLLYSWGAKDIGAQPVTLDSDKDYKFVLEVTGEVLHGQVFEIGGGMVSEDFRDLVNEPVMIDDDNNQMTPDIPFAPYVSGFSGVLGFGAYTFAEAVDFTIDNFQTVAVPEASTTLFWTALFAICAAWRAAKRIKAI